MKRRPRKGFPTKIKILHQVYKIRYWNKLGDLRGEKGGLCVGLCDYDTQIIDVLDTGQPRQQVADTLLHEILHAICKVMGIDTIHEHKQEEQTIRQLTAGFLTLLVDNELGFWK